VAGCNPLSCPLRFASWPGLPTRRPGLGYCWAAVVGSLPGPCVVNLLSVVLLTLPGEEERVNPFAQILLVAVAMEAEAVEGRFAEKFDGSGAGCSLGGRLRPARDTAGRRSAIRKSRCPSDLEDPWSANREGLRRGVSAREQFFRCASSRHATGRADNRRLGRHRVDPKLSWCYRLPRKKEQELGRWGSQVPTHKLDGTLLISVKERGIPG